MQNSVDPKLYACFEDKLVLPPISEEENQKLLKAIEQNFHALVLPWILTSGIDRKDIRFLEIGCGDGKYGSFISSWVKSYCGLDIRETSIKSATSLLASKPNCKVIFGNGRDFSGVESESQDLIFSYQTFIHMPSIDVIESNLKEVVRALSPGGIARIQLAGPSLGNRPRLTWKSLGAMRDSSLTKLLRRLLPADFLVPKISWKRPQNAWGRFAPPLHPLDAQSLVGRLGAFTRTSPSYYDFVYSGTEFGLYWLTITKQPNRFSLSEKIG